MEKVILHAHSCWSHDSSIELKEWRNFIVAKGISKLYLTEHEESGWDDRRYQEYKLECESFSCKHHKIIAGLELNIRGYHILAPGLRNYSNRPTDLDLDSLKKWVDARGSFLIAAHPDKYHSHDKEILALCTGIELINTKHQYNWVIASPTRRAYELMQQYNLQPFLGQDIHRLTQFRKAGLLFNDTPDLRRARSPYCQRQPSRVSELLIVGKNTLLRVYVKLKKTWKEKM